VISISHAVAKGVRKAPGALHVCYCLTPMRYAWDLRDAYVATLGRHGGLRQSLANRGLDRLREWDRRSAARVDRFAAISRFIAARIDASYGRDAQVIYPPVDTEYFTPVTRNAAAGDHYLTASRWVPYKRIDAIVGAFRALPHRRLVVTGDGPEAARIRAAAGPNVKFVGDVSRARLRDLMRGARAFLFAAEEDFGIVPIEAQGLRHARARLWPRRRDRDHSRTQRARTERCILRRADVGIDRRRRAGVRGSAGADRRRRLPRERHALRDTALSCRAHGVRRRAWQAHAAGRR
jgi:glycosyltransferase involved in cell wall biosynthesis